jgi:hypothetical protein
MSRIVREQQWKEAVTRVWKCWAFNVV